MTTNYYKVKYGAEAYYFFHGPSLTERARALAEARLMAEHLGRGAAVSSWLPDADVVRVGDVAEPMKRRAN